MTYDRASEAAANSRRKAAISDESFSVETRVCGKVNAYIVYEEGVNPYFVYASSQSIKISEQRPTSSEVDHVRRWRPY